MDSDEGLDKCLLNAMWGIVNSNLRFPLYMLFIPSSHHASDLYHCSNGFGLMMELGSEILSDSSFPGMISVILVESFKVSFS